MENLKWTVKPAGSPKLVRRCARCGYTHFISSGRFRVNANGSRIDVWLIWRCEKCSATWNMDILSRVRTDYIDRRLYQRFLENDEALALHYALDQHALDRSGAVIDSDAILFDVDGTVPLSEAFAQIIIIPTAVLSVSAAKVIAQKLEVSQSAVRRLAEKGLLVCNADIRKKKLTEPISFILHAGWGSLRM